MKAVYCPYCGGRTKRNGRTSSGSQRWRCTACGASTTVRYDDTATRLDEFLGWLLSKDSQAAMPGGGRSFRRRTAGFWEVWPMPVPDGELHRVLYVDGIWVARDLVVLICCSGERVVSWYMARSENSRAWSALMAPIPAPEVVVTDGGSGFAKAVRETWPRTRVQRCTFHAFSQVAAEGRPAQPPRADVGQAREGGVPVVPRALGGREGGAREARRNADRRGHRLPVQRLLRLAVARGRRAGVGRQSRVGGPPPQGPVPVLAGLMDGNGCSIGTHILSYKPRSAELRKCVSIYQRSAQGALAPQRLPAQQADPLMAHQSKLRRSTSVGRLFC